MLVPLSPSWSALALSAAIAGGALSAQTTHLVGPGGFPQIANAIAVAVPGDVIVVQPGIYQPFMLSLGVTLRAQTPGTAVVMSGFGPTVAVPPGQAAHLVGLQCASLSVGGRVTLDDCTITGGGFGSGLDAFVAQLHLQGCTVNALPAGSSVLAALRGQLSEITAIDCRFRGADATPSTLASPGIDLLYSRLRGSSLTVDGGIGGTQAPGIAGDAGSTVWLADSVVTSNAAPCAIAASAGAHARCTLSPNCSGIPIGPVLGVSRLTPLQNGLPFQLAFRSAPLGLVGVFAAPDLANTIHPDLVQSLLLAPASAFPVGVFVTDAQGLAIGTWSVPAGPAFVDRAMWWQAFAGASLPLAASAVAGGVVR